MSQENVEVVRASLAALATGDVDAVLRFLTHDVEVIPARSEFPELTGPHSGHEATRSWLEEVASPWGKTIVEVREAFAVPDDRVVVRLDWGGQGATSGIATSMSFSGLYTVRGELISRVELFFNDAEALNASGLEE
jgi:ketosteroid isomerase-like protein